MPLDHEWIERHIPHAGRMCLLDAVIDWDASQIRCRASSHRAADNPLRAHGRLGAACGVEYAAQSMAIHGALVAEAPRGAESVDGPRPGYLASVRGVSLFVERLDDVQSDLIATAIRVTSDSTMVLYEFSVASAERILLSGRATIIFDLGNATRTRNP